jgi:hypothetical protein
LSPASASACYVALTDRKGERFSCLPDGKSPADIIGERAKNAGEKPAPDQAENDGRIDPRQCVAVEMSLVGEMSDAMGHDRRAAIVLL